jgi:TolB-like protein
MKSYQQFFAELKRRKVFKVAAVYGATAFGLLQIADLLKDGFGLPDTFIPFITAVVLLGFPLALILAWALEVTPDGLRRTELAGAGELAEIVALPASKRWPAGLLALAGFVALVGGVWLAGQRTGARAVLADGAPENGGTEVRLAMTDLADDPRPSIAVLPFADMSPEGDQEYFSDGMTEEILNVLAKVSELRVTARTSAFAFKGRQVDLRDVGDSLGVRYIVEGSVRKAADRIRITAQLIDATDGSHMWSDSYDRTLDDVFAIQSELAEAIAGQLRVPLGIADPSGLVTPTADLDAYDLYLAGRGRIRERGQGLSEAIRLFEAAIARDSTWAPAWAGLAEATELMTWYPDAWEGGRPPEFQEELGRKQAYQQAAELAARRALDLDPMAASARVALGSVHRYRHEWKQSEAEYLRALETDPDNPEAFQQYSEMLGNMGRGAESVRTAERALALDRAPIRLLMYSSALASDGRLDEGIEVLAEAIALDTDGQIPQAADVWYFLNLEAGNYDVMFDEGGEELLEARDAIVRGLESGDLSAVPEEALDATLWMIVGRPDSAAAVLLGDISEFPNQNNSWLWDAIFDPLRDQPAYLEALERLNLVGATPQRTPR